MQSNGRKNLPALRLKDKGCFRRSRSIAEGTPERTLVLLSAHTKALSLSLSLSLSFVDLHREHIDSYVRDVFPRWKVMSR